MDRHLVSGTDSGFVLTITYTNTEELAKGKSFPEASHLEVLWNELF